MTTIGTRAAAAIAGVLLAASVQAQAPFASVEGGRLAGRRAGDFVDAFLGIPYAASTAAENRWRAPRPASPWRGTRDASRFGPNCTQGPPYYPEGGSPWTAEFLPNGKMDEDCLSLNVWAPRARGETKRPVLVWIHGGGFAGGSGSIPIYDGTALAARGIVVVTINYRVGVFGFLAHPALTAEQGTSGNYGLMDQAAALRWVRRNIAAFGGDPSQVTVAGQSAGAASVHYLLAAPSTAGLFRRAIAQSGSGMGLPILERTDAERLGSRVATAAGVESIDALRRLPAQAVMKASADRSLGTPPPRFFPIRDGVFLPDPARQRTDVPILTGLTTAENSTNVRNWLIETPAALDALLERRFPQSVPVFRRWYIATTPADAQATARRMLYERGIASMLHWYAARPEAAAPVYAYLWAHPTPGRTAAQFGAFHTAEVPYVFGTLAVSPRPYEAQDYRLERMLGDYWISFIRTGTPHSEGHARWPSLRTGELMSFDTTAVSTRTLDEQKLRAYRAYFARGGAIGLY